MAAQRYAHRYAHVRPCASNCCPPTTRRFKICYEIFEDSKNCYSFEELSDYVLKFESNYYAKEKVEKCIRFLNPQSMHAAQAQCVLMRSCARVYICR